MEVVASPAVLVFGAAMMAHAECYAGDAERLGNEGAARCSIMIRQRERSKRMGSCDRTRR